MSGSTTASSYQSVREQLISLQVDLDDKKKVCAVLEQKIGVERSKLGRIEADATQEYEAILEAEFQNGQHETERLKATSEKMVDTKRSLVQRCQQLVSSIKDREADLAAERRKLHKEAVDSLDRERSLYRGAHAERLAKYLGTKASEEKERTGKALQPEFARLQQLHEREMADAEERAANDRRGMQEAHQKHLDSLLRAEREMYMEQQRSAARQRAAAVQSELSSSEREHRVRLDALRVDLEAEMDKLKAVLEGKVSKERSSGQSEVQRAQEAFQQRLQSLRSQHMTEMNAVLRNHEEQCRQAEETSAKARAAMEVQLREQASDTSTSMLGDAGEPVTDAFTKDLLAERDRLLQAEIRRLQAESIRLERDWKTRASEQRVHIESAREKEEAETKRRQRGLTEEVSELVVEREQLGREARGTSDQLASVRSDLESIIKEIDVYRSGISVHRMRQRDISASHAVRASDEQRGHQSRVDTLKARTQKIRQQCRAKDSALARDLAALEALHVGEMEKLDRAVKGDVVKKDGDLELLRDAVATEKVKVSRLEKLLQPAAPTTAGRGRGRH